jgi:hypothetical protein
MPRLLDWDGDFGIFFCTQGVSNIGDAAWGVLIPLYVLQLTHNPGMTSSRRHWPRRCGQGSD